jgi:hypothetical protein
MLEHLHGEWADDYFTEDGRRVHRRVDGEIDDSARAEDIEGVEVARSPECNGCSLAPICLGVEVSAAQDTDGEADLEGDTNALPRKRGFWVSR